MASSLLVVPKGSTFDEMMMPEFSSLDLDLSFAAKCFKGHRKLDEQELLDLRLLSQVQDKLVPTVGGMLLFGRDRMLHFPSRVQCIRFVGCDRSVVCDRLEINDPLPQVVENTMLFLEQQGMHGADDTGIQIREMLREITINALVHSDYSQGDSLIQVAVFDDRIEVRNPGGLLSGMAINDLKQGISKIRNPVIAKVFRELGLIKQWGSGLCRIFRQAEELRLPMPEIVEVGMEMRFVLWLAVPTMAGRGQEESISKMGGGYE
jgi:ATP-dependent DNA helicase RecG